MVQPPATAIAKAPDAKAPEVKVQSAPVPAVAASASARKEEPPEAGRKLKLASTSAASAAPAPEPAPSRPATPAPAVAVAAVAAPAAPAVHSHAKAPRASGTPWLGWPLANRALALVVLVLIVAVVYSIASIQSGIDTAMASQVSEAGELAVVPVGDEPPKPPDLDKILQKVAVRDIFQPLEAAVTATNAPAGGKTTDFKLVGVSIDAKTPEATMAILRNKASAQTYFVKVGEALGDTGYTLGRVLSDHVILKKQKQEIEVR